MHQLSTVKLLCFSLLISPLFFHTIVSKEGSLMACDPVFSPTFNNTPQISPTISPTISPVNNVEVNPHITNYVYSLSYAVGMKIRDITIVWIEEIKKKVTTENYELAKEIIKKMLWKNRYRITGGTVLGSYSITSLLLCADYHYLSNNDLWSQWKPECTFEGLCAISQKDLARELLLTVGQRYYNEKNPTDLAHPLIQFISAIDTEIHIIKRYISMTKIIKRLRLITVFPTNDTKIGKAQQLLERALFVKHIFLSWLSEYNLTSTNK